MLTEEELRTLIDAKQSNPWWFDAVLDCAAVMQTRVRKYSGGGDPYRNFVEVGRILSEPMTSVFRFYIALKFARALVSQSDFDDESYQDTLRDLSNYSLLWQGYEIRRRDED